MTAAMQYSTLFSSGLLSRHEPFPGEASPQRATVPLHIPATPPRAAFSPQPPPKIRVNTQLSPARPNLRKRRSSLNVAVSPMGGIKSPNRMAGMSYNRALLMSPSKSAEGATSFMTRLRSGSVGTVLRSRRGPVTKPAPTPPTAPLPALPTLRPSSPTVPSFDLAAPPSISNNAHPRRPQARRILTDSAVNSHYSHSLPSAGGATLLSPDFALKLAMAMSTPPPSALHSPVDESAWQFYDRYLIDVDEEMKEN